jgi:hypothetical protein
MARLHKIAKGIRQLCPIRVPLKNMDGLNGITHMDAALSIIADWGEVVEAATKYTIEHGCKAEPGHEMYDYQKAVYTVAVAVVDAESDPANPRPFFGTSENPSLEERAIDVRTNTMIGRDTVLYLAECQDVWQNECSPQPGLGEMTPEQYYKTIGEIAAEGPLAFLKLSAGSRLKLLLFTANLLLSLAGPNTTYGSTPTTAG